MPARSKGKHASTHGAGGVAQPSRLRKSKQDEQPSKNKPVLQPSHSQPGTITRRGLYRLHRELSRQSLDLMRKKNRDYAGQKNDVDPFANFRLCEALGICSAETGVLVRLADKLARLITFVRDGKLSVENESAEDTCLDMINYPILLRGLIQDTKARQNYHARQQFINASHDQYQRQAVEHGRIGSTTTTNQWWRGTYASVGRTGADKRAGVRGKPHRNKVVSRTGKSAGVLPRRVRRRRKNNRH